MDPTERSVSPEKSDIDLSSLILGPATPHVPARDDEDDDNGGARQIVPNVRFSAHPVPQAPVNASRYRLGQPGQQLIRPPPAPGSLNSSVFPTSCHVPSVLSNPRTVQQQAAMTNQNLHPSYTTGAQSLQQQLLAVPQQLIHHQPQHQQIYHQTQQQQVHNQLQHQLQQRQQQIVFRKPVHSHLAVNPQQSQKYGSQQQHPCSTPFPIRANSNFYPGPSYSHQYQSLHNPLVQHQQQQFQQQFQQQQLQIPHQQHHQILQQQNHQQQQATNIQFESSQQLNLQPFNVPPTRPQHRPENIFQSQNQTERLQPTQHSQSTVSRTLKTPRPPPYIERVAQQQEQVGVERSSASTRTPTSKTQMAKGEMAGNSSSANNDQTSIITPIISPSIEVETQALSRIPGTNAIKPFYPSDISTKSAETEKTPALVHASCLSDSSSRSVQSKEDLGLARDHYSALASSLTLLFNDDSSSSSSSEPDLIELSGDDEPDVVFVPIDSQISDSRVEQVDVGRKLSASENCRTDEIVNLFDVPPSVSHLEPQNRSEEAVGSNELSRGSKSSEGKEREVGQLEFETENHYEDCSSEAISMPICTNSRSEMTTTTIPSLSRKSDHGKQSDSGATSNIAAKTAFGVISTTAAVVPKEALNVTANSTARVASNKSSKGGQRRMSKVATSKGAGAHLVPKADGNVNPKVGSILMPKTVSNVRSLSRSNVTSYSSTTSRPVANVTSRPAADVTFQDEMTPISLYRTAESKNYILKQSGTLLFPVLPIHLDICFLEAVDERRTKIMVFFNLGSGASHPPAWEGLPIGQTVKAVEHSVDSGLEYTMTFHFDNIAGSPKVIVNARQTEVGVVQYLANWMTFSDLEAFVIKQETFMDTFCIPVWKPKMAAGEDLFGDLLLRRVIGTHKMYKYQKLLKINVETLEWTVLVFDRNVVFARNFDQKMANQIQKKLYFGTYVEAFFINGPTPILRLRLPIPNERFLIIRAEVVKEFSSTKPVFGVVRGNVFAKMWKNLEPIKFSKIPAKPEFRMLRSVTAICKAEIHKRAAGKAKNIFLFYLVDTVVIPAKQMTDADLSKILEHERKKPFHEQIIVHNSSYDTFLLQFREKRIAGCFTVTKLDKVRNCFENQEVVFTAHKILVDAIKEKYTLKSWSMVFFKRDSISSQNCSSRTPLRSPMDNTSNFGSPNSENFIQNVFLKLNPGLSSMDVNLKDERMKMPPAKDTTAHPLSSKGPKNDEGPEVRKSGDVTHNSSPVKSSTTLTRQISDNDVAKILAPERGPAFQSRKKTIGSNLNATSKGESTSPSSAARDTPFSPHLSSLPGPRSVGILALPSAFTVSSSSAKRVLLTGDSDSQAEVHTITSSALNENLESDEMASPNVNIDPVLEQPISGSSELAVNMESENSVSPNADTDLASEQPGTIAITEAVEAELLEVDTGSLALETQQKTTDTKSPGAETGKTDKQLKSSDCSATFVKPSDERKSSKNVAGSRMTRSMAERLDKIRFGLKYKVSSSTKRQREPSDASFDASSQEDDDDREQYSVGVTENEETKVMNVVVRDGGTTDVLCDLVIRNERGGDIDDNCDLVITSVQSVQEQDTSNTEIQTGSDVNENATEPVQENLSSLLDDDDGEVCEAIRKEASEQMSTSKKVDVTTTSSSTTTTRDMATSTMGETSIFDIDQNSDLLITQVEQISKEDFFAQDQATVVLRDCQVRMSKTERQLAEDALLALPVITLANFDQLPISGRRFVTPKVRLDNIESLELYPDLEPEKKLDLTTSNKCSHCDFETTNQEQFIFHKIMAGHEKGKVTPPTKPKTAYFDGDIFDRLIDSKLLFRKIMSSRNAGKDADLQNTAKE